TFKKHIDFRIFVKWKKKNPIDLFESFYLEINNDNNEEISNLNCDLCQYVFMTKLALGAHLLFSHSTDNTLRIISPTYALIKKRYADADNLQSYQKLIEFFYKLSSSEYLPKILSYKVILDKTMNCLQCKVNVKKIHK
ncbi:MAG: hypothetical protein MHPSP_002459, partial [Paramarteilia canceri]